MSSGRRGPVVPNAHVAHALAVGQPPSNARPSAPAYFHATTHEFLAASSDEILGQLAAASEFDIARQQRDAWERQIEVLHDALRNIDGHVYLEFDIPRLGSRIDVVLLAGPAIFPLEFKNGETQYRSADFDQAWDYALDLKNFHASSHDAPILPMLVATDAPTAEREWAPAHADGVRPPLRCNATALRAMIRRGLSEAMGAVLDGRAWGEAPYRPTPTIIQAARALYARHSVDAISRHDAGARNLRVTSQRVERLIDEARRGGKKAIVFVTGVPGAGKTLVGLNVATMRRRTDDETHAVFLSGNGPLVAVLREALVRDEVARLRARGGRARKGAVEQNVKPFIQNVHHFRDEGIRDGQRPPHDRVVIFDEAQRAWNREKTANFMRQRKKVAGFAQSEPEFLISYMDRHPEWAVVVCLVGGGQEIHTGEAGIAAWLDAVREKFPNWSVHVSQHLGDSEYAADDAITSLARMGTLHTDPDLHLSTSMRSFRSEKVSAFVKALLDCEVAEARSLLRDVEQRYPVVVTRDLHRAKQWIRKHARGSERFGLVASSQAQRLKPHAIDVRVKIDPVQWFLNDAEDTRSSYYLEDAATEFQIQGLELDWICVTWDADLRHTADGWSHNEFRGDRWVRIKKQERQRYLLNAYRVLLTRARQGMVIFVPRGAPTDRTRAPELYDETYGYLVSIGVTEMN